MNITSLPIYFAGCMQNREAETQVPPPPLPHILQLRKLAGLSAESFGLLDVSRASRRWLNCLDMSSDVRKLPSDVRILVLTTSGGASEAPEDRQAKQRVRR